MPLTKATNALAASCYGLVLTSLRQICTWVCLMFFALQLDRGNISQALSDNMLEDLNLSTNDYNTGQTVGGDRLNAILLYN